MTGANEMVSIGMPVYNDKAFLPAALDSLRNQIYQNFELIISDDCSTDGSADICLQAQQMDKRVKYIRKLTAVVLLSTDVKPGKQVNCFISEPAANKSLVDVKYNGLMP